MSNTARALLPLAVFFLLSSCRTVSPDVGGVPSPRSSSSAASATPTPATLAPSPNLIVGRVIAVDSTHGFAFIDVAPTAPPSAREADRELLTRRDDLSITAHLRTTRQVRGRSLGTIITSGAPNVGDEVVFPTSR